MTTDRILPKEAIYKAYIASNVYSHAFDSCISTKSPNAAIAAVRRKNSPGWHDCVVWAVIILDNGDEQKI